MQTNENVLHTRQVVNLDLQFMQKIGYREPIKLRWWGLVMTVVLHPRDIVHQFDDCRDRRIRVHKDIGKLECPGSLVRVSKTKENGGEIKFAETRHDAGAGEEPLMTEEERQTIRLILGTQ